MTIQVFTDETGDRGQGPIFAFASLAAPAERWLPFVDEWRALLSEPPELKRFKMRELARRADDPKWAERLRRFAQAINTPSPMALYWSVNIEGFDSIIGPRVLKPLTHPYFLSFFSVVANVARQLYEMGARDEVEFIFDEHSIWGPRVMRWYPVVREVVRDEWPILYDLLPPAPIFKDDEKVLPLQACDMLAWLLNRHASKSDGAKWNWIFEEMPSVWSPKTTQYLSVEKLQAISRHFGVSSIKPEQLARYRRAYGEDGGDDR